MLLLRNGIRTSGGRMLTADSCDDCACDESGDGCYVAMNGSGQVRRWPLSDLKIVASVAAPTTPAEISLSIDGVDLSSDGGPFSLDFTSSSDGLVPLSADPGWQDVSSEHTQIVDNGGSPYTVRYRITVSGAELTGMETSDDIGAQEFDGYKWTFTITFIDAGGTTIATYTAIVLDGSNGYFFKRTGTRRWDEDGNLAIDPAVRDVTWNKGGGGTAAGTIAMVLQAKCWCPARWRGNVQGYAGHTVGAYTGQPLDGSETSGFFQAGPDSKTVPFSSHITVTVSGVTTNLNGTYTLDVAKQDYIGPDAAAADTGPTVLDVSELYIGLVAWVKTVNHSETSRTVVSLRYDTGDLGEGKLTRKLYVWYQEYEDPDWVIKEQIVVTDRKISGTAVQKTFPYGPGYFYCPQVDSDYTFDFNPNSYGVTWFESPGAWDGGEYEPADPPYDSQGCWSSASMNYENEDGVTTISGGTVSIGAPTASFGYPDPFYIPAAISLSMVNGPNDGDNWTFVRGGSHFDDWTAGVGSAIGAADLTYYAVGFESDPAYTLKPIFGEEVGDEPSGYRPVSAWQLDVLDGDEVSRSYLLCPSGSDNPFLASSPVPALLASGTGTAGGMFLNVEDGGPIVAEWGEVANPYA